MSTCLNLLSKEFLDKYSDFPEHMTELAQFVYYRTYSRWLESEGRRETWKESVARAVNYNVSLSIAEFNKNRIDAPMDKITYEAEILFDNIFNLKQFLSGRTHWVGGADTGVATKFPLANFNCAFVEIRSIQDITDLFYLLLVGTGVGFKATKDTLKTFPSVRTDFELIHSEFKPISPEERLEITKTTVMINGYAKIYVGDSKEGWVEALRSFFNLITSDEYDYVKHIKISYNSIRAKGEKLKTFGGTASGYEPLRDMFENINKVVHGTLDTSITPPEVDVEGRHILRPIHILDIGNCIGNNVVVGGVRRTAEIFLCEPDDYEVIFAKYGINGLHDYERHLKIGEQLDAMGIKPDWWSNDIMLKQRTHLKHRYMSNNSILFESKPSEELFNLLFDMMRHEGEPAFVNLEAAKRRRPNAKGVNPCGEVLLDSNGVCNLTTVNIVGFVKIVDGTTVFDLTGLMQAQALSVRAGMRMTLIEPELDEWKFVHHRDRLIGCSLTGWKDAMDALEYDKEQEDDLLQFLSEVAVSECVKYSHILRIPTPLLNTTIKPEGTLSQVANGVSSGLHRSFAPYYIRRIRINAHDPLVKVAKLLDWSVKPEVGYTMQNALTLVVEFPVKSLAKRTEADQTVDEQFDTYFQFQDNYTSHNSSNTIKVKSDEWDRVKEIMWERWDEFIGISFLSQDEHTYELAPYEEITEDIYNEMKSKMLSFDREMLTTIELFQSEQDLTGLESCSTGVCPIV